MIAPRILPEKLDTASTLEDWELRAEVDGMAAQVLRAMRSQAILYYRAGVAPSMADLKGLSQVELEIMAEARETVLYATVTAIMDGVTEKQHQAGVDALANTPGVEVT